MRARVAWNFPALVTFYNLHLLQATALDRAIVRFAETGEGALEWDPPYHRLRTATHDAMLSIDVEARVVTVIRIYRAAR